MKTRLLLTSMVMCASTLLSQSNQKKQPNILSTSTNQSGQKVIVYQAASYDLTGNLKDMPITKGNSHKPGSRNKRNFPKAILEGAKPNGIDPVLQTNFYKKRSKVATIQNWDGQFFAGGSPGPTDPSGAAGPNHYVQAINSQYQIWDKKGNSLTGPHDLNTIWPNENLGDPIVIYDKFADKWVITQFSETPNGILIAVSKTNDPTGQYHTYRFNTGSFPDYPKFSIWHDGYYMSSNDGDKGDFAVFERDKLLAGDQTAKMVYLKVPNLNSASSAMGVVLPAYADGQLPPKNMPCTLFSLSDDAWGNGAKDALQIFKMNIDWNNTSAASITHVKDLEVAAFDGEINDAEWTDIPQPGVSQKIDGGEKMLMYRAQFRMWTGYNTMMISHVVDVNGSGKAGVRWYELRDKNDGDWTVHQQGTYSPDAKSRFYSSVSMDGQGNIGLAYCISDATNMYPSLAFTGRMKGDPLGKMTIAEVIAHKGTGSQAQGERFADYSHMSIDPTDDLTFWHTGQYNGNSGAGRTRIFSFKLALPTSTMSVYHKDLDVKVVQVGQNIMVNTKGLYNNNSISLDLFALDGKLLIHKNIQPVNKSFSELLFGENLPVGVYLVRVGNQDFQKVVKITKK